MPTVLRAHGLRFVIFVGDHAPPHVHVRGRGEARFMIEGECDLMTNKGMSRADIARARIVIRTAQDQLLEAWSQLHG